MIISASDSENYYRDYTDQTSTARRDIPRPIYTRPEREAYQKYKKELKQEEFDFLINNKIIPGLLTIAGILTLVVATYHLSSWWWPR